MPEGASDCRITDIVYHSGQAGGGSLFACIRGVCADGHHFAEEAAARARLRFSAKSRSVAGLPQGNDGKSEEDAKGAEPEGKLSLRQGKDFATGSYKSSRYQKGSCGCIGRFTDFPQRR